MSAYIGHALIDRSIFISNACSSLRIEALKLAINEIIAATGNVELYQDLTTRLNATLEAQGQAPIDLDLDWMSSKASSGAEKTER
jgi:hypothetical protein